MFEERFDRATLEMTVVVLRSLIVVMLVSTWFVGLVRHRGRRRRLNLGFFVGKEHPIIGTFLNTFGVFEIWGWILAAIGLSVVNKLSKGAAWTIVILIVLIGLGFRLVGAMFSGNAS